MPEENSKNQSADSVSDALISDNDMNWLSQKKHIIFDINKKDTALISSKADPMTCSDNSITLRVTCRFLSFLPGGSE